MQTERCSFIKPSGERCRGAATGPHGICWHHSPANAERRSRMASRAARSKGNREVAQLKAEIKQLIADVKAKDLDRNDGAAMLQGYRVLASYLELERRIHETDQLAAEIAELREELGHEQTA